MAAQALHRAFWSGLALSAAAVLLASRWLTPSPHGVGTHLELGLPPCGFLLWSGLPCPACGLTTAFAWLARGELVRSLHVNPLGLPLFVGTLLALVLSLGFARRAESPWQVIDRYQLDKVSLLVVIGLLVSWAARLLGLGVF